MTISSRLEQGRWWTVGLASGWKGSWVWKAGHPDLLKPFLLACVPSEVLEEWGLIKLPMEGSIDQAGILMGNRLSYERGPHSPEPVPRMLNKGCWEPPRGLILLCPSPEAS